MPKCDNFVFWSPVPAGSTFKIKATGDTATFRVRTERSRNGEDLPDWMTNDLVPGPASQAIAATDRWDFTTTMTLTSAPNAPIKLEAWVEDGAGNDVQIPGPDGPMTLRCDWEFDAVGASVVEIVVAGPQGGN